MEKRFDQVQQLARQLRVDSIRASTAAGSGHPSSSLSAADLMAVLLSHYLHYDFANPHNITNDHLIFSKGHASPLLYSMYKAAGVISDEELLSFRKFGSRLQGHPTPIIPWVDIATGSLGQGLPIAVGVALAGKYLDKQDYRTWVLCGDSEMAEGSIWEACDKAGYYHLHNLIAILDMNRLGQRGPTALGWNSEAYAARIKSFGWHVIEIDGHNLEDINRAYSEALQQHEQPTFIVAKTIKGRGVSAIENQENWHGKALSTAQAADAIKELGGISTVTVEVAKPESATVISATGSPAHTAVLFPVYAAEETVATRKAYGDALKALGAARLNIIGLDGEVSNSTYADEFAKAFPERYFEMFIAEQQLVASAVGLSVRGYIPFASTFAAFLSRAYDFIRMAAISQANIRLCGSHAGVSIGEDGPSQMALEDLAMMRAVHGSIVLYPSDPYQTAKLVAAMADTSGISYIRTTREKMPIVYSSSEEFPIGGSKVLRQSDADRVTIVAAGITLHEALKAHARLEESGVSVRVIDAYCVKPVDQSTLRSAVEVTGGRLVVVEDHWAQGGLGEAVLVALSIPTDVTNAAALQFIHLAVREMPGSGTPQELLHAAGIDADHIVQAVQQLIQ